MRYGIAFVITFIPGTVFGQVIINEVAWMGTTASANDEWIELYNPTQEAVNLSGWTLRAEDGSPATPLSGSISAKEYMLVERTDNESVPGIQALVVYSGALENRGETLLLFDSFGNVVDEVDGSQGWPAGDRAKRQTMEFVQNSWVTSVSPGGTPGAKNSEHFLQQQKIPLKGYMGYRVGVSLFPFHFVIALTIALGCSLSILALKRLIDQRVSSSSGALED